VKKLFHFFKLESKEEIALKKRNPRNYQNSRDEESNKTHQIYMHQRFNKLSIFYNKINSLFSRVRTKSISSPSWS